jgi:hypothetical protein
MTAVHDARSYVELPDKKVLCTLCPHDCRIPDNGRGACRDCGTAIGGVGMSDL